MTCEISVNLDHFNSSNTKPFLTWSKIMFLSTPVKNDTSFWLLLFSYLPKRKNTICLALNTTQGNLYVECCFSGFMLWYSSYYVVLFLLHRLLRISNSIVSYGLKRFRGSSFQHLFGDISFESLLLVTEPELTSRGYNMCSHTGLHAQKDLSLGLMLFCCVLIFLIFEQWALKRIWHWVCKLCSHLCIHLLITWGHWLHFPL